MGTVTQCNQENKRITSPYPLARIGDMTALPFAKSAEASGDSQRRTRTSSTCTEAMRHKCTRSSPRILQPDIQIRGYLLSPQSSSWYMYTRG